MLILSALEAQTDLCSLRYFYLPSLGKQLQALIEVSTSSSLTLLRLTLTHILPCWIPPGLPVCCRTHSSTPTPGQPSFLPASPFPTSGFSTINLILEIYSFCFMYMHVLLSMEARRGVSDPLELEFQTLWATMWVMDTELRSCPRAASALNHWAMSTAWPCILNKTEVLQHEAFHMMC